MDQIIDIDFDKIQAIVNELDKNVTQNDALLKFIYLNKDYNTQVIANRLGYLRFGIEFLKAAFMSIEDSSGRVSINISYLFTKDSENPGYLYYRKDDITPAIINFGPSDYEKYQPGVNILDYRLWLWSGQCQRTTHDRSFSRLARPAQPALSECRSSGAGRVHGRRWLHR